MLKGFEHAWICTKCQGEHSVVTSKEFDTKEKELENEFTPCCGAKYEYIGFRPIIVNIAANPILKADPDYVPPIEEEVVNEIFEEDNTSELNEQQPSIPEEQKPDAWEAFSKSLENKPEVKKEPKVEEEIEEEPKVEEVKVTVEVQTPVNSNVVEAKSTSFNIDELVPPGPKGVSNAQMIPAMKNAIKENSKEKLDTIKSHYPDIFDSSIKYIGKKMQDQLKALGF